MPREPGRAVRRGSGRPGRVHPRGPCRGPSRRDRKARKRRRGCAARIATSGRRRSGSAQARRSQSGTAGRLHAACTRSGRRPVRQLRRVLGNRTQTGAPAAASARQSDADCCIAVTYLHTRPQTVVNFPGRYAGVCGHPRALAHCWPAGARRQVAARIPAAPRGSNVRGPRVRVCAQAAGMPLSYLQCCSIYCNTALLEGSPFRFAHRRPACCNCLR